MRDPRKTFGQKLVELAEKNAKLMEQLSGSRDGAIKAGADKYYADQLSAL